MIDKIDIPENEQWKLRGDCNKCRRATYCSHVCSAAKKALRRDIIDVFATHMVKRLYRKKVEE